ncbi:hypothetical protein B0I32_1174 [Nonomuraea fuscirosea]|uniref:Uncharacterized protein n=1 Tax=Nonomuraea fuscirosea TaxID=1291556 RepID=A0A2T0MQ67_9ACTN|nr:hypothetical protein B0I32_1174 [Nonomuraea fuscirosea]
MTSPLAASYRIAEMLTDPRSSAVPTAAAAPGHSHSRAAQRAIALLHRLNS